MSLTRFIVRVIAVIILLSCLDCYIFFFESDDAICLDSIADEQCKELGYDVSTSDYGRYMMNEFTCLRNRELSSNEFQFTREDREKCKRGFF